MNLKIYICCLSLLLSLLTLAAPINAQTAGDWSAVSSLRTGTRVFVETDNGQIGSVRFQNLTGDALVLAKDGRPIAVQRGSVMQIYLQRRPSRTKRSLIGALAGAGAGALIGVVATVAGGADPLTAAGGFLIGIPAGAVIGAATAQAERGPLLYRR
jgi:hypothetical protein